MAKQNDIKVGDVVRVVNEDWADGIGTYRAAVLSIMKTGRRPFIPYFATISWRGRSSQYCTDEFGVRFEVGNLRKV